MTDKATAIARVEKRIVPVSDANPHVSVLVYARNGRGKTRFAASGPKTLIIDVNEKGTRSVRGYDAHVFKASKWEDITFAYWFLREGNHDFETFSIDTLTQVQHLCMKHVLKNQDDRDPNRPPNMPDRRSWGQMTELMKPVILNFRNLPMNCVFVCQERVDKGSDEDEDAVMRIVPDLSPGVRGVAMGSVEVMGRMYRKEVRKGKKVNGKIKEVRTWQTRMLVGPHEDYETKDRTGKLGHIMIEPTMDMVLEASHTTEQE